MIHVLQSSQDADCLQSCLRALRILGSSHSHRLSICHQGGLTPCASLLSSAEPGLVCAAVRAVCELSRGCSLDCAEQLSPAVPNLVLLAGGEEVKAAVRQAALGTLCNLCSQGALRPMLGNAGTVQLLIQEARVQRSAPTRCLPVLKALCLCCREALNRRRLRELGGLELMLDFLRDHQYRSVHSRIIAALLHFCHDTAALTLLGSGGLAALLAQRLEELARTAGAVGDVPETRIIAEEEEDKASTSFDFPPEPRNKKLCEVASEDRLRSWLLSEGYICSLEDLSPEWPLDPERRGPLVSEESDVSGTVSSALAHQSSSTNSASSRLGKEIQLNSLSGAEQRPTFSPTSSKPDMPITSTLTCQSPLQEILGSRWPLGPRSPLPAEVLGPEFPGLLLLSRLSQLSDSSPSLVCPQVLKGLLTYVTCHPRPSPRAARLLQDLTCDPSCLEAFIRTGTICTLRARLLLCESPENDSEEYNRHAETTKELGHVLLRNLCIQAESPFGVGAVTHMLVSGPQADRRQCALCLPFIYRKDSPHRRLLLDGALRLILEPLMFCMDPVFFFHASECLSALVSLQNLPAPCLPPELVTTRCCYQDLLSKRGSDVVFVLDGGERIEGNRKEVTGACEVFRAMLGGSYVESQQREVYVQEVPPCAFIPLLHYLHGCTERALCPTLQELPVPTPGQDLAHSPLGFTLAAAGRFLLPGLQQELEKSVRESLLSLDTLPSVYCFAETHESAALRRDCCVYLLRGPHPPRKRASSLFQLCQRAQDKHHLALLLEDVVLQRN
ncbi:armadillo repeat-containing protein 5 isoform X2 [Spea bombifrons]|nr:armadillo repeat-containing protein 5 isoform X2 [Spea bombifrons]